MLSSVPSPPGCLRPRNFCFGDARGSSILSGGHHYRQRQHNDRSRTGSVHGCTQCAYSHSGFSTPYLQWLHGSGVDDRERRHKVGGQCARACGALTRVRRAYLWRAQRAYATPLPQGGAKPRSSARGQRDVAVCITTSTASALVNAVQ